MPSSVLPSPARRRDLRVDGIAMEFATFIASSGIFTSASSTLSSSALARRPRRAWETRAGGFAATTDDKRRHLDALWHSVKSGDRGRRLRAGRCRVVSRYLGGAGHLASALQIARKTASHRLEGLCWCSPSFAAGSILWSTRDQVRRSRPLPCLAGSGRLFRRSRSGSLCAGRPGPTARSGDRPRRRIRPTKNECSLRS